jgi:ABC-2 type transport system ATP-binding protein
MTAWAIETDGLSYDYPTVRALDGLTLQVPEGAVFGFLGPNGAGKTTTIRLLLGLLVPTQGQARVFGRDPRTEGPAIRAHTGALLEHSGIYERLSAADNLDLFGRLFGMGADERALRIRVVLSHLGLWDRRRELAGTWSRGMKQKLAIARALLHRPPLVLLDEPTAGMDPAATASLRADLSELAALDGATVFMTTHNLAEVERVCTLVGIMREGRLIALGAPDALRARAGGRSIAIEGRGFDDALRRALAARPTVEDVTVEQGRLMLRLERDTDTAELVRLVVERGGEVTAIRPLDGSLEDYYLALMGQS